MSIIKGYKPHENQKLIHDSIRNEHHKYYACNIGRQFGKTLLGINQMLDWFINDKGCYIGWVSPIYKQSKKVYKELKKSTEKSGLFKFNDTDLIVEGFGSTIQFFSGERPDNIRGFTFDYLVGDEIDYLKKNIWEEVLQPTILVKGKKVLFLSTPKGKGLMYNLSIKPNYDERYKYFHFTSYDNPLIDHREIDSIRANVPEHVFKQEYLAQFVDDISGLFKYVDDSLIKGQIDQGGKLYGGLDIGRADDYTVLNILNSKKEQVYIERWRHDEWSSIIDKVAKQIKKYRALTYVEVNNQGDVFYEMLKKKCGNLVEPFVTSTKTKPIMVEDLAVCFENKEIKLIGKDYQIDELKSFTYIYNPKTRRVQYSAPEGIHDDTVISLALAVQSIKNLSKKGEYTILK